MNIQHVYIGNWGNFPIPPEVVAAAIQANNGKPLSDRRTKGAKILKRWGMKADVARGQSEMCDAFQRARPTR